MERSVTRQRWERSCRELVRFALLMRRMALDLTLSRRWREDVGALSTSIIITVTIIIYLSQMLFPLSTGYCLSSHDLAQHLHFALSFASINFTTTLQHSSIIVFKSNFSLSLLPSNSNSMLVSRTLCHPFSKT